MHWTTLLAGLSLSGTSLAALGRRDTADGTVGNSTLIETKKFIIEFAKGSDYKALADEIASRKGTKVVKVFDSEWFHGVSVEATTENTDTLGSLKNAGSVWQSKKIKLAPNLRQQGFSDDASAPLYDIHHMTGVDKLHEAGVFGKGATVAIIDTGTQYTHPALGGGFGPGFKVAGGYDLVGDTYWPITGYQKEPDADPSDNLGHGTHVAGIVAGKSENWMGVAPEATLLSYKVFSRVDGTDEETLIDAFLMAAADGADIITASIGGAGGWSTDAWAEVASRLVDSGIVVTIAAGNNGAQGIFFGSNGASGKNVLAVASVEADVLPASPFGATFSLGADVNTTTLGYLPGFYYFPPEIKDWPIIPISLDPTDVNVGCLPLPDNTPNLTNAVVLMPWGGCTIYEKQLSAEAFGAQYILFYNEENSPLNSPLGWSYSITGTAEHKAGVAIIKTIAAGGSVTADFSMNPENNYVGANNAAGGVANYFTSLGGTYDLQLKPDVAAPGGDIFSTYPDNSYAILSGTSMACPYVAGVAALYIGKNGGRSVHGAGFAKDLAMRIMSSGGALKWSDGDIAGSKDYGFWAPVPQVGTGMINAAKVLGYTTSLSWAKFALNDTHHFSRYQSVDITNNGPEPVTYKFSVQDAGGYEALDSSPVPVIKDGPYPYGFTDFFPIKMTPKVKFPSGTFTVKPGQTKKAEFIFSIPEGLNADKMPVYSGKILIDGTNGEQLSVPYMGVGSDIKKNFDNMFYEGFPQSVSTNDWIPIEQKPYYTFDLSVAKQDFPKIGYRLRWGGQHVRWDIFEAGWKERSWKYPPVVGENGYVGSATSWVNSGYYFYVDPDVDDVNDVLTFPMGELFRSSSGQYVSEFWWFGKLASGEMIKPGNYTMRFAALSPFGDPTHGDNWSVFKTPQIQVLPRP